MAQKTFSLEAGGPRRLTVAWRGRWRETTVSLDGRILATISDEAALRGGQDVALGDGSILHVQLGGRFPPELRLERDGKPMPGSASDPDQRIREAWIFLYLIAGFSFVLGIIAMTTQSGFLGALGAGMGSMTEAVVFGCFGWLVRARRSRVALLLATALFGIETIMLAGAAPGALVVRGLILLVFVRALMAMRTEVRPAPALAS